MSDTDNFDSHKLDVRRRKLYFRSCHRGIKEMDIIFSRFARAVLAELDEAALDDYERMLEFRMICCLLGQPGASKCRKN